MEKRKAYASSSGDDLSARKRVKQHVQKPAPQYRSSGTQVQLVSIPLKTFRVRWMMRWNTNEVNDLIKEQELWRFNAIEKNIQLGHPAHSIENIKEAITEAFGLLTRPIEKEQHMKLAFTELHMRADHPDGNEDHAYGEDLLRRSQQQTKEALTNGRNGTILFGCRLITGVEELF